MAELSIPYNFVQGEPSDAEKVDANFAAIETFVENQVIHRDGTKPMNAALSLAGNATSALHAVPKQQLDAAVSAGEITGVMKMWAGETVPPGYLICGGQAVSRTTYAALFAVIGTNFGAGNGSTTFNIPHLAGRFPRGVSTSPAGSVGGNVGGISQGPSATQEVQAGTGAIVASSTHTHDALARHQEVYFIIKT